MDAQAPVAPAAPAAGAGAPPPAAGPVMKPGPAAAAAPGAGTPPAAAGAGTGQPKAPDTTGKPSVADGKDPDPVPYHKFKAINERANKAEMTVSEMGRFLDENPDIREAIEAKQRGRVPKPVAGAKPAAAKPAAAADAAAAPRDAIAVKLFGEEYGADTTYESLTRAEKIIVDDRVEAYERQQADAETRRVENLGRLSSSIEALAGDPLFKGIKIDADEVVLFGNEHGIFDPRAAAIVMNFEAIVDRVGREAAEAALTRKAGARDSKLETGEGDLAAAGAAAVGDWKEEALRKWHQRQAG